MKRIFAAAIFTLFAFTAATVFALLAGTAPAHAATPDFPRYNIDETSHGPCIYWQQQDYYLARELWSQATDDTKRQCVNAGDYVLLKHCLDALNTAKAQTDQLQQIEHPQPFHH
jgi:hypothetical protein